MEANEIAGKLDLIESLIHKLAPHRRRVREHIARPLTGDDIIAFENGHRIELPTGFRHFLFRFGDEAPVPRVVMGKLPPLLSAKPDPIYDSFGGKPGGQFQHSGNQPIAFEWDEVADDYTHYEHLGGTMCLGSGGCDIIHLVVINGSEPGMVWTFAASAETELFPQEPFLDWVIAGFQQELSTV